MQVNKQLHLIIAILSTFLSTAAVAQGYPPVKDTLSGAAFSRMVEQSLSSYYAELASNGSTDSIVDALAYEAGAIPVFTDDEYCKRLAKMNEVSNFGFDCNTVSLATIKFFAEKRRNFAKVVLGRSKLYFDLYEEKLAEYDLPLELKYLSVIESGLRPQVKSRAGALGLWQFMYATGKQYGLTENSYIDERMDPLKATDAACRYLKKLYSIYDDWNLALAAYNAGPGNVNKAIKRSGGKRTYWEIRPFLPSETQGYVPNFIAATYLLTYHAEHNIVPAESKIHYYQLDTMCLNSGIHMQTIDKLVGWTPEDIQSLNPVYKTTYIPPTYPQQCITGPLEKIGLLVSLEDSLYITERRLYGAGNTVPKVTPPVNNGNNSDQLVISNPNPVKEIPKTQVITTINYTYHRVKTGESLGKIASQYNASIQEVMDWNQLTSTRINVGQMLKIQTKVTTTIENPEYLQQQQDSLRVNESDTIPKIQPPVNTPPKPQPKPEVRKKFYSVRSGDTFSAIASRHGLTVTQLKKLNPGVNASRISVGQKIRIK
jgi:membrane-bound lytic murein transglycosylase D